MFSNTNVATTSLKTTNNIDSRWLKVVGVIFENSVMTNYLTKLSYIFFAQKLPFFGFEFSGNACVDVFSITGFTIWQRVCNQNSVGHRVAPKVASCASTPFNAKVYSSSCVGLRILYIREWPPRQGRY